MPRACPRLSPRPVPLRVPNGALLPPLRAHVLYGKQLPPAGRTSLPPSSGQKGPALRQRGLALLRKLRVNESRRANASPGSGAALPAGRGGQGAGGALWGTICLRRAPQALHLCGGTAGRGRRAQKTRRRGRQMAHVRLRFLLDVKPKLRCGVRCSGETNQKNDQKTVPRKQNRKTNFRERSLAVDLRW